MIWIFLFQIILYYIILSIFYLLSILYKKSLSHWQNILYYIKYTLKIASYIYWLIYNHNIFILFYKVIFIKSFYKVVTEARFARRPTGGRPYTHSIQKNNQIIVCPEMSWILFHIILYYTILYLLSILYKKIFESLTEYNILYKIYIKLNCMVYILTHIQSQYIHYLL